MWAVPTPGEPVPELTLPSGLRTYRSLPSDLAILWEGRLGRFQMAELRKCGLWVVASGPLLTERLLTFESPNLREISFADYHGYHLSDAAKTFPDALALLRVPFSSLGWHVAGLTDRKGPIPAQMPLPTLHRQIANIEPVFFTEALLTEADALVERMNSIQTKRLSTSLRTFFDSIGELDFLTRAAGQVRALRALHLPAVSQDDQSFARHARLFTGEDAEFLREIIALCRADEVLDSPRLLRQKDAEAWTTDLIRLEEITRETLRRIVTSEELRTLFEGGDFWHLPEVERYSLFGPPVEYADVIRVNAERNAAESEERKREAKRQQNETAKELSRWVRFTD